MTECLVTVVVAAYNKPVQLRTALESVIDQTHEGWCVHVVGDQCNGETAAVVPSLGHPRVRFSNLEQRFGEQGGPNSVGIALAETEFVALLNHDDLYLPNHLSYALQRLRQQSSDFFIGRAAHSWDVRPDETYGTLPRFSWLNPKKRDASQVYCKPFDFIEPCSSWVLRRDLAEKIGHWRPGKDLCRFPIQDYLLRAWRAGARFDFGQEITTLKLGRLRAKQGQSDWYLDPPEGKVHENLLRRMRETPQAGLVDEIEQEVARQPHLPQMRFVQPPGPPKSVRARILHDMLINPATAYLYRAAGLDAHAVYFRLRAGQDQRGEASRELSMRRTGFDLQRAAKIDETIRELSQPNVGKRSANLQPAASSEQ